MLQSSPGLAAAEDIKRGDKPRDLALASCVPKDGFEFEEFFQPGFTPLTAIAGLLVASEARTEVQASTIDVDIAGANLSGNVACAVEIAGRHEARQAIRTIVRDPDRVFIIQIADDGENRSKDLLTGNRHVIANAGKDGGLDEIAAAKPLRTANSACGQLCTFIHPALDEVLYFLKLCFVRERPQFRVVSQWVPDLCGVGDKPGGIRRILHPGLRNQQTSRSIARLPGVPKAGLGTACHRLAQV